MAGRKATDVPWELTPAQLRLKTMPASPLPEAPVRRVLVLLALAVAAICPPGIVAQSPVTKAPAPPATDLDRFMNQALLRRDIDRKTLSDYVLDEVETFEVLGPGRIPFARMRYEFTWYVRDGFHVRSPVKVNGVPMGETERRAYENRWVKSEEGRRKFRTEREAKREQAGKPPTLSAPSINEPRFISESYFMDFKFEPGNYFLAGKETLDGQEVLKIDYLPTVLFSDDEKSEDAEIRKTEAEAKPKDAKDDKDAKKDEKPQEKKVDKRSAREQEKEKKFEEDIERKMNKSSQITLWVDPKSHQIVKYTFDNVWLDFLPAGWLVKVDDLRASMQMGQPFPGIWLPRNLSIHAGVSIALGPMELSYKREFANYRKADVSTKVTVPK
jgi:hypothetical protein